LVVPFTLRLVLYCSILTFRDFDARPDYGTLPLRTGGGLWLLYLLGYNLSSPRGGFIPLRRRGEFGVVNVIYLGQRHRKRRKERQFNTEADLHRRNRGRSRSTCQTQGD